MRAEQRQISPIETYARHGNFTPSTERLERIYSQLSETNVVTTMLVVADVCLDLAAQAPTTLKDTWINRAKSHLNDVQSAGVILKDNGQMDTYKKTLPHMALAKLKQSELTNWSHGVHDQNTEEKYQDYLSAITYLVPWMIHNPSINSKVLEFMPILIGARASYRGERNGWFGRLALFREDNRVGNMSRHRTNWDTGISTQPTPEGFLKPPIKLQIKSKNGSGRTQQYERSGVQMMTAPEVGVKDILKVLAGCIIEAGMVVSEEMIDSIYSHPADTKQIDEITERMAAKIEFKTRF
jgi:hypothetical protein